MITLTEAKLIELLEAAYNAGVHGVHEWRRLKGDTPRLQDVPELNKIRAKRLAPLIEAAKQK